MEEIIKFKSLEKTQAFFARVTQKNSIVRKHILIIAKRMRPTSCRPPKNCIEPTEQELMDELCMRVYKGELQLVEINPKKDYIKGTGPKIIQETDPFGGGKQFFKTPDGRTIGWLTTPSAEDVKNYGLNPHQPTAIVVNNNGYQGSLDTLLKRYEGPLTYCGHYSRAISINADYAQIGSIVATAVSGGLAVPGAGIVSISATVVSVGNGIATFLLCGPDSRPKLIPSHVSTVAGLAGPPWWQLVTNIIDAALSAAGK
ncbi:MAG: hypothetical protein GY705_18345 [Bacteroidetes bacterium]|nr:hypothetical protein [Bacteroidota bacterium]